jgi:hypothetical protein
MQAIGRFFYTGNGIPTDEEKGDLYGQYGFIQR